MTVAYAALHRTLTYRGEDTGLYVAAFDDGTLFFSRHQPPLEDAAAKRIEPREVLLPDRISMSGIVRRTVGSGWRRYNWCAWPKTTARLILLFPDDGHL